MMMQLGTLANTWLTMLTGAGTWAGGMQGGAAPYPGMAPPTWPQWAGTTDGGLGGMSHEEIAAFFENAAAATGNAQSMSGDGARDSEDAGMNTEFNVRVRAQLPTEVIPNLPQDCTASDLVVDPLYASDRGVEPINSVDIGPALDGSIDVSVFVPDQQPPGRYSGPIRTRQGDFVGGLTVVVHPLEGVGR
jgi:hypothetical protein